MGCVSREDSHQGAPTRPLEKFPRRTLKAAERWHRCHLSQFGPWFYASHQPGEVGGGRWDLPSPRGTCYMAQTPQAALREVAGPDLLELGFLTRPWLAARSVSEIELGTNVPAANLLSPRASDFGASAELTGALPYELTQTWARAWDSAGFGGIYYGMRFATNRRGLGLFGDAGPGDGDTVQTLPALDVATSDGLTVVEIPSSRSMNVVDPT